MIPYIPACLESVESLFDDFLRLGSKGQLVGQEGTGKTTLLEHLACEAERRGLTVERQRAEYLKPMGRCDILCLDSAQVMSWIAWKRLLLNCARESRGLLIAAHTSRGLPTLYTGQISSETACRVVRHLLVGWDVPEIHDEEIARLLTVRHGNLRLALFDLYDWYERIYSHAAISSAVRE